MSIIMRNISGGNSIGSASKGFPPGDVTIIYAFGLNNNFYIKFSDPDTSIYNGTTLSTWQSTILVRNDDHYPTSIKDGTIVLENTEKDKYKNEYFTDSELTNGKTYYYRFYTMNADKVYNDSTNMIYKTNIISVDTILKNNDWDKISAVSKAGFASSIWNIGDEIDITLSGDYNETVTLQIWDFNHFDKTDGTGKAGIVFGMKNLMKDCNYMQYGDDNNGGWNSTYMCKTLMNNIYKSLPATIHDNIEKVYTYASNGYRSESASNGRVCSDFVFLPGYTELFGKTDYTAQSNTEKKQTQFPIFTDANSRIKKLSNGNGGINSYWTRSPYFYSFSDYFAVQTDGTRVAYTSSYEFGICFCFNI